MRVCGDLTARPLRDPPVSLDVLEGALLGGDRTYFIACEPAARLGVRRTAMKSRTTYQGVDVRRKKHAAFSHMSFCVARSPSDGRHAITVSA